MVLLFAILCGCSGKQTIPNCFSSEECKKWIQHAKYPFVRVEIDKRDSVGMVMYTRGKEKGALGRSFKNPFSNNTPVDFHIKYQTKDCCSSQLVACFFNQDAALTGSDTFPLPQTTEWAELSGKVKTKNCDSFTLTIECRGVSDNVSGRLSVKELSLSAKGEPLPEAKELVAQPIKAASIQAWEGLLYSPLMDKKILSIGETVHGTETLGRLAFSLMKERVCHHQGNLLLIELPVEYTLTLNRYVKNDRRFEQDDTNIKRRLKGSLLDDSILQFVDWVREYNATHNNEVSLYGVDCNPSLLDSKVDLCDFLYALNRQRVPAIDTLCRMLLNNDAGAEEILQQMRTNEALRQELTETEYKLIQHCLSTWSIRSTFIRFGMRDDFMAAATQKLVVLSDTSDSRTTMYLHFGHAGYHKIGLSDNSYADFPDIRSMGQMLKAHYGDDYACLALTCLQGKATLGERQIFKTKTLKDAPENSLEYQTAKTGKDVSYLPAGILPARCAYYIRHIGNKYSENQFLRLSPQAWMDGIVVANKAEACKKDNNDDPDPMKRTMKRLEELYKKIKP